MEVSTLKIQYTRSKVFHGNATCAQLFWGIKHGEEAVKACMLYLYYSSMVDVFCVHHGGQIFQNSESTL